MDKAVFILLSVSILLCLALVIPDGLCTISLASLGLFLVLLDRREKKAKCVSFLTNLVGSGGFEGAADVLAATVGLALGDEAASLREGICAPCAGTVTLIATGAAAFSDERFFFFLLRKIFFGSFEKNEKNNRSFHRNLNRPERAYCLELVHLSRKLAS